MKFEVQYSINSLYPPSLYSGMVMQLIRVLPRKGGLLMEIVGAGGRYNSLVNLYRTYLEVGVDHKEELEEMCATGFSISVDRFVSSLAKLDAFEPRISQVEMTKIANIFVNEKYYI